MPPKRAPKAKLHELAVEVAPKTVVTDVSSKKQYVIGKQFATGGFGRIYTCNESGKSTEFVIKIEPSGNGPLFTEVNVFNKILKQIQVEEFKKSRKLKSLGMPYLISCGIFTYKDEKLRYLIMPKYATSLESVREKQKVFDAKTVFTMGKGILQSLEYVHEKQYTHADVKAANILLEKTNDFSTCVLVDFGLARMSASNEEKADKKRAHNGTAIFTSLDAHRGFHPSYRGDLEILAYNLIYWLTGDLPWTKFESDAAKVLIEKENFVNSLDTNLKKILAAHSASISTIAQLFDIALKTPYTKGLDFKKLYNILDAALSKVPSAKGKRRSESPIVAQTPAKRGRTAKKEKEVNDSGDTPEQVPKSARRNRGMVSNQRLTDSDDEDEQASKTVPKSARRGRPSIKQESTDKNEDEDQEEEVIPVKSARRTPRQRTVKEESPDYEDEEKPRKTSRARVVKKKSIDSDDDYEEEVVTPPSSSRREPKIKEMKKETPARGDSAVIIVAKSPRTLLPLPELPYTASKRAAAEREKRNNAPTPTPKSTPLVSTPNKPLPRLPMPRGFESRKRLNFPKQDVPVPGLKNHILPPLQSVVPVKRESPIVTSNRDEERQSSPPYVSPAASPSKVSTSFENERENRLSKLKKTPEKIPNSVKESPTQLRSVVPGIRNFARGRRSIFISQITKKYQKLSRSRKSIGKTLNTTTESP